MGVGEPLYGRVTQSLPRPPPLVSRQAQNDPDATTDNTPGGVAGRVVSVGASIRRRLANARRFRGHASSQEMGVWGTGVNDGKRTGFRILSAETIGIDPVT